MKFAAEVIDGNAVPLIADARPQAVDAHNGTIVLVDGDDVQVLAPAGSAKAALYRVAARNGMNPAFPDEVLAEVDAWEREPHIHDANLDDLTHLAFVTIDGKTSRDLDQALHVEADGDGHIVRYALADASFYVRPGSALFDEALRRGASYYLPGVMIPMLPRALSEGLVSLNPNVDRRSLVFTMRLDAEGRCTSTELSRARIRSRAKLDWGGVQAFYDGGDGFDADVETNLHGLAEVGRRRMALAEERGVVRYRRSEVVVKLGGQEGLRFVVLKDVRRAVERYNEQLSLLCNIEGALLLRDGEGDHVEPIYRVHPPPDADKLRAFERMLDSLVKSRKLDPDVWLWNIGSERPIADYLDQLPTEGEEGRLARAIHRQAVMVNVRSTFQTTPSGHHGVGAEVYARFSAPMREIVGVYLHAEAWERLRGEGQRDEQLRDAIVVRANEAKQLQRKITDESNRLVLDQLFKEGGETFKGTVMGLTRGKIHVMLDLPPIDVKVYMRHQQRFAKHDLVVSEDGSMLHDEEGNAICGLGDEVQVKVQGRDEKKDRWILTVTKT